MKRLSKIPKFILILAVVLITIRIFLPSICLHYINQALSTKMGNYVGHLEDFDLSLWRGAYQLQGLEIKKREGRAPALLTIREVDLSLAWRALFRKELSGDITVDDAVIRLADSQDEKKKQLAVDEKKSNWQDVFDLLIPISIESLKVYRSAIYFTNRDLKVELPIRLEEIEFSAEDIRTKAKNMQSPFQLTAKFQDHAPLWVKGTSDILSSPFRADLDFKLNKFKINSINDISRHYVPLDFTEGTVDVFGEAATSQGRMKGYVKLFYQDGDIIAPKQQILSVKHLFFEIATAFGNWILKNNSSKKVAARIPFEYDGKSFNIETSEAFWSTIKNAFDEMKPELENSISLKSLEEK